MFSGIVEEVAKLSQVKRSDQAALIRIDSALDHESTAVGDSIAVNGVCLTVIAKEREAPMKWSLDFELASETLRRTSFSTAEVGSFVNLERSLCVADRISGHFVFGHVDEVSTLVSRSLEGESERFEWSYSKEFRPFLATKGSVCIQGVSLTVGEIEPQGFSTYLIPHTLAFTTLGKLSCGEGVNLEADMLARYVAAQSKVGV